MSAQAKIHFVDDEEAICNLVSEGLTAEGYVCDIATNANDVYKKLETYNYDVVLLDIRLPGKSGIEILEAMQEYYQKTSVVMMTAVQDLEIAIETMKLGASDYVTKPFTLDKLNSSVRTALKNKGKIRSAISDKSSIECEVCINGCEYSFGEINAIAQGIEAQIDYLDSHSKIVTQEFIEVCHMNGILALSWDFIGYKKPFEIIKRLLEMGIDGILFDDYKNIELTKNWVESIN